MEDEKSKRIKNVKFMYRGADCFTYGTLYECVYFILQPKKWGLSPGMHLWTATVTLKKQII